MDGPRRFGDAGFDVAVVVALAFALASSPSELARRRADPRRRILLVLAGRRGAVGLCVVGLIGIDQVEGRTKLRF